MQARPGSFVLLGVETTPSLSGLCQTQGLEETYRKEKGGTKGQRRWVGGLERGWQLRVARNGKMAFSHNSAKVASLSSSCPRALQ